jgi:chromosome segregation ATPase
MTITGKVFLFLTLILAAVFPALVQPVWQHRSANQKALVVETEKLYGGYEGEKRKPGLLEQVDDAERERKRWLDAAAIQEQRRISLDEAARRMRTRLETELALLRDRLADAEVRSATMKSALAQTDAEVNARDAEIKEMDAEVQQAKAFSVEMARQVAELKTKLESSRTEIQKILLELQDRERLLADVMKKQPDAEEGDVASATGR